MHNTILQRVNEFLNAKMINLEKIKLEKYLPPFSEDLPLHHASIPFLKFFWFLHLRGKYLNFILPL